jgi:hypothetical protein
MDSILPAAVQWRRDKFDFTPHLARGMLAHHRSLLDSVLSEDTGDIGRYVDLGAVRRRIGGWRRGGSGRMDTMSRRCGGRGAGPVDAPAARRGGRCAGAGWLGVSEMADSGPPWQGRGGRAGHGARAGGVAERDSMTILTIAHRPSMIASADRVIVLDCGRIVEQGRYNDLIQRRESRLSRLVVGEKSFGSTTERAHGRGEGRSATG